MRNEEEWKSMEGGNEGKKERLNSLIRRESSKNKQTN